MIPRWQMIGFAVLVMVAVALAIQAAPNSYAHMFLAGRCFGPSPAAACHPRAGYSSPSGSGARVTP